MVQKILIFLMCAFMIQVNAKADDSKLIQLEQLPPVAQQFVLSNFSANSVSYVMQDEEGLFGKEYDVILTNGNKIEFDKKGVWTVIEFKTGSIPWKLIPQEIADFIKKKHAGMEVKEIERGAKKYEIKLSNGMELHFNKKYEIVGYDD